VKDVICEESARLSLQVYRDRLRAIVLTGSLARNEGTFVQDQRGCRLLGDAELLLVYHERIVPPHADDLSVIRGKIEERIHRRGVRAEVTLTAVGPNYLRRLPPSIFAYELRACGEIIAGDPAILDLIPIFTPIEIPLDDAWRLLANRLVEQLESVNELLEGRPTLSPDTHYRTVKLYLDMATSLLVFAGHYAPTYEERAQNLTKLLEPPFPLKPFADEVAACTEWKISARDLVLDADRGFWERAIDQAEALWRWELAHLQQCDPSGARAELMDLWMRRQPLFERLRGWAHVVRQNGWHRSASRWPQWARRALKASPRYAVYATATDLLFALRSTRTGTVDQGNRASGSNDTILWHELNRGLPVLKRAASINGASAWQALAADALFNYRAFLSNTRS
jgi:hypothetical protein